MPTLLSYYLDTNLFTTATAVYTDATLTTKAADGFYQSGGVYREQSSGLLGSIIPCLACNKVMCGDLPNLFQTDQYGIYDFDINLGTQTGAWQVVGIPFNMPNGFFIDYDGTTYSSAVSSQDGYLAGPYFGNTVMATTYGFPANSPFDLPVLRWDGGTAGTDFSLTGTTENIVVAPGDFTGSVGTGGEFNWFISKPNPDPQTATIRVIGCVGGGGDSFQLTNHCAEPLTGFSISAGPKANAVDACAEPIINTYYNGPVGGTDGEPGIYDVIFVNSNAATTLATALGSGFYGYSSPGVPTGYFEIDANSVIITIGTCPP
jgi:hypothetical protein